jgi:hypothetical protein
MQKIIFKDRSLRHRLCFGRGDEAGAGIYYIPHFNLLKFVVTKMMAMF